jgi:hypothetical protein
MQPTLKFFLLIASVIGAAQAQTWTGTYTVNTGCSTTICCCLSGQFVVTSTSTNYYTMTSPVSGQCNGATTSTVSNVYLSGYTGSAMLSGNYFTYTLSSDSKTITATNVNYTQCSGSATKSGANKQHTNSLMLFVIGLVGMMMMMMNASKM